MPLTSGQKLINVQFVMKIIQGMLHGQLLKAVVILLATLSLTPLSGQEPVPVEVSDHRTVIGGKEYFLHVVLRGQTLYSISRAYNVTIEQIRSENIITDNGIREGQMLQIPVSAAMQKAESDVVPVPAKDTLPRRDTSAVKRPVTVSEAPALQGDEKYIFHRVRRGETLASVARQYGITVRDLKRANRGLLFPQIGDYLRIPRKRVSTDYRRMEAISVIDTIQLGEQVPDTMTIPEEAEIFTVPEARTEVTSLTGSVRVALLLPFYIDENNRRTYIDSTRKDIRGDVIYREVTLPSTWIYEGSLPFLEAYEGILMAADSLRSLGLTIEMDVYDTCADTSQINSLIWSGKLDNADLIIGPVFSYNLGKISSWATERNIPVVSPVPLRDRDILSNRPTLYRVFPSELIAHKIMAGELRSHPGSNVVFLHGDSAMYDPSTLMLWESVRQVAKEVAPFDTIGPVPYWFTGMSSRRDAYSGVTSLDTLFSAERENIVILASKNSSVISSAFSAIHSLLRKYDIRVIGYPDVRDLETIDLKYFYDLELFIPAECYVDINSPEAKAFSWSFMKRFRTEPMAGSFAWRGFDIAWYFIGGMALHGHDFLMDPGLFNPVLLCLEPDFRRDSRSDGYENRGMFILQYRKNMTIDVRRPWPRLLPVEDVAVVHEADSVVIDPVSGSSVRNQGRLGGRQR
jgi:LysM repeat protein